MAIDFGLDLYTVCQNVFSRAVTVTPIASNPTGAPYGVRGIYGTRPIEILPAEIGIALIADQETIFDILDYDFSGHALPVQGDRLDIPPDPAGPADAIGSWEITSVAHNGGSETTLTIRKFETAAP